MNAPKINLQWVEDMQFQTEVNGHKIIIDAEDKFGGKNKGPRPKPLLEVALAGCTAMDVISILKKMKQDLDSFNVEVEGELNDEHPMFFKKLHLIYTFKGKNIDIEKINKAVTLSQNRYCGVSATLAKAVELSYEIKIIEN